MRFLSSFIVHMDAMLCHAMGLGSFDLIGASSQAGERATKGSLLHLT